MFFVWNKIEKGIANPWHNDLIEILANQNSVSAIKDIAYLYISGNEAEIGLHTLSHIYIHTYIWDIRKIHVTELKECRSSKYTEVHNLIDIYGRTISSDKC